MPGPPPRRFGAVALCLVAASTPVAAQQPTPETPAFSPLAGALASAFVTFLVAGGLVALKPDYAERTTDRIRDAPGKTLVYGVVIGIAGGVVAVLLALTIIGLVVAIPLLIALAIVGFLGYLAAGRAVSERWGTALAVAVAVAALTGGVPILGGIVGFLISSTGVGAAFLDYRDDEQGRTTQDGLGTPDVPDRSGRSTGGPVGGQDSKRRSGPSSESGAGDGAGSSGRPDEDDPSSPP